MLEKKDKVLDFFKGDILATNVWKSKYKFGDEQTPKDMHKRHIDEIAEKELKRMLLILDGKIEQKQIDSLSDFGKKYIHSILGDSKITQEQLLTNIKNIFENEISFDASVLGGSMLQGIGNHDLYSSLSNCFVLGQPYDSYSGINKKEDELCQVMKRRGGAGLDLSTIRPAGARVHNQAKLSSGIVLFAEGYSSKTKQVAQDGRRGALMLSCSIKHNDSLEFIISKQDKSKITGANISVKLSDDFMKAVEKDEDFILTFPVDKKIPKSFDIDKLEYDKITEIKDCDTNIYVQYVTKIKAKIYWETIIKCAWSTAEPGILFEGNWERGGLDYCYEQYRPISTNPCSEIPMQPFDACRLLARNLYTLVKNPFTKEAKLIYEEIYKAFYLQLIIGDLLIDLEIDYLNRIIDKISKTNEPNELKKSELELWTKIKNTAQSGRRCGAGFTAFADMLAALNMPYYSKDITEFIFNTKMKAELDATIDMAKLYGSFDGYDAQLESTTQYIQNVIAKEFPEQYEQMIKYGRRNVSWSTAAPVGTGGIMTQATSGIEPLFKIVYERNKKCVSDSDRVDFVNIQDGEKYTRYFVLHPKFVDWFYINCNDENLTYIESKEFLENCDKNKMLSYIEKSPWYGNEAENLNWEERVEIQSIVQKYTTHAISSTINLPKDCSIDLIGKIYMQSWKSGLKGNTVYREGSREGILVSNDKKEEKKEILNFDSIKAPKRPRKLPANYHTIKYKNKIYSIIIGFYENKPYELFIISGIENIPIVLDETAEHIKGEIVKDFKDWYNFVSNTFTVKEISDVEGNEKVLSLMISTLMRQRTPIESIIKVLDKSKPIAGSFTHRLIKILSQYIEENELKEKCSNCGGQLKRENGCILCIDCGWTKC